MFQRDQNLLAYAGYLQDILRLWIYDFCKNMHRHVSSVY